MTDIIKFDDVKEEPNIIKVIGVGGGGSNAVTHMFTEGIKGVDFILCNTDRQALEKSPVSNKLYLGNRTLGAGNVPAEGRNAAMETIDAIKEVLSDGTKMLFVTAGMGGGTGTGAAPVVASVAKELGILTVGIVTMPFTCEGKRRQQQALEGIEELRKQVDALLIISNDKLRDEFGNMKLSDAFKKADDVLKTAAKGIAEIITVTGYVNVDFEDVSTVMRESGKTIMGAGYAEGDDRAEKAVEQAVHSPLLDDSDLSGAKNILIYITSGSDEVTLDEVMSITEYVQNATGNCSEIIWGNGEDQSLGKGLNVTLIATRFADDLRKSDNAADSKDVHTLAEESGWSKNRPIEEKEPEQEQPVQLDEPVAIIKHDEPQPTVERTENEQSGDFSQRRVHTLDEDDKPIEPKNPSVPSKESGNHGSHKKFFNPFRRNDDDDDLGLKSYVKNQDDKGTATQVITKPAVKAQASNELSQQEMLRRQRLASLNMSYKTQSGLEAMENQPAYKRLGLDISNDLENETELSNYSSKKNMGLSKDNPYVNDNVD